MSCNGFCAYRASIISTSLNRRKGQQATSMPTRRASFPGTFLTYGVSKQWILRFCDITNESAGQRSASSDDSTPTYSRYSLDCASYGSNFGLYETHSAEDVRPNVYDELLLLLIVNLSTQRGGWMLTLIEVLDNADPPSCFAIRSSYHVSWYLNNVDCLQELKGLIGVALVNV